jgi:hypothetical protein
MLRSAETGERAGTIRRCTSASNIRRGSFDRSQAGGYTQQTIVTPIQFRVSLQRRPCAVHGIAGVQRVRRGGGQGAGAVQARVLHPHFARHSRSPKNMPSFGPCPNPPL